MSQHHYQNKSWTNKICHAVWRIAEFSNVCDHLLQTTTASYARRIKLINRWIKACGMLFNSCTSASRSPCCVSGGFWRWRTRLPSSSHKCSIGDITDDNADQGRTRMCFWFRKSWQARVAWHLVLSCWKTWSKFHCCRKDRTIGSRISSVYFTAFNVPWTILSWVRPAWQILAQTIKLPPPKQSDSYAHWSANRSPRLRYTR